MQLPSPVPAWVLAEREAAMTVMPESVLDGVGFLLEGNYPIGTGFFVCVEEQGFAFTYFLTATHVIYPFWRLRSTPFPPDGEVTIRVNRIGEGVKDMTVKKANWFYHPDRRHVDLCAAYIDENVHCLHSETRASAMSIDRLAISSSLPEANLAPIQMMLGDEVFLAGLFLQRPGVKRNLPIVRTGNIAALPHEPIDFFSPRHPVYLLETKSLGGISGSPVFFEPSSRAAGNVRTSGAMTQIDSATMKNVRTVNIVSYRFVGMVTGTWHTDDRSDFLTANESGKTKDDDWNTGISVVIPDVRIKEFLMSDQLAKHREEILKNEEKKRGVRFTGASKPERPTTEIEGDEKHRERFTALLDEAVGKPKRDD